MFDYTGKTIFLGIDVHKRTYSVSVVYEGCIVKHDTFVASPEILVKYCQRSFKGASIKSAYEAGFCGFFLHRFLIAHGIQNTVVHPASIEVESRNYKKADKRDSKKIAIQLAAGRLNGVYVPTLEKENRRAISRLRESYARQKIRIANQLKSLLNLNGVLQWDESPRISKKWLNKLLSLDLNEDLKFCIKKLAEAWLYFSAEMINIEKKLNLLTPEEDELYIAYRTSSRNWLTSGSSVSP